MSLIVQKFGGTSVATSEKIMGAARKAIRAQQQGHQVVMVVSAMGKQTDVLVDLARQITEQPPAREMDMLLSTGEQVSVALMAMAIHALGGQAVSLTGGQIGIKTDSSHTKARIQSISSERMRKHLDDGHIVIAAGFQGVDDDYNITTLGRGGSDTTAVALAAVLRADSCEIYTDVDGVFTTDPRIVPSARKMERVSHDEMLELASLGAGVMHSRSIEFGKKFDVPIHVRNSASFSDEPGSIIGNLPESSDRAVSGCALTKNEARISLTGVPDKPGTMHRIFSRLATVNIAVDMIVQNIGAAGVADIAFTVLETDLPAALKTVGEAARELGGEVSHDANLSKVSVVGLGMATQTGVADRMFRALADARVNIQAISTSQIKISALVERAQGMEALRAVHDEFELEKPPQSRASFGDGATKVERPSPVDVVSRLQRMEDLTIDDIRLDQTQGRITISQLPDSPGIAAEIFEAVAAESLLVDMIVQGAGRDGLANLSFTVPRDAVLQAVGVAMDAADRLGCGPVSSDATIAILSVFGVGIRTHVGVGARMFKALSEAGINVEMINTSEVRVNVVVAADKGEAGLKALRTAFADVMG
ncbi:MAG: aspartate kinase [Planctomycetaceae bacterium]|uniref:aspartate kinase n=1 Tax=Lacipirellula limnantheis TaxID=2528024 RepID=A0A517TUR2_9BACT|nr:aspartate kinase [Lacipirellula limnantheis]MBL9165545.1 aspartate kinase [Planctomycetaceae bacterium]QDT72097.1 Aspartokinase [Lacipirellula limnantheis]